MKRLKRSSKNLIFSALGQVVTILIGLLLPRLYAVSYGSEVNGLVNSVNQYIVYLSLFEAGVGTVALQALYKPVALDDKQGINAVMAAAHAYYRKTGYLYLAFLSLLSLAYPFLVKSEISYWTIVCVCFFSGVPNAIFYLYQGKYKVLLQAEGKNYILSNLTTIVFVLNGLCKVVLISLNFNVAIVIFVSALLNLIQLLYIMWYINRHYKWIDLKVEPNYQAIGQKKYALVHQVSALIFQNTDVLILTIVSGLKVVSVYSVYKLVITHLESIISVLISSINYILGQLFQVDKERYKRSIDAFESYYGAISFALFSVALYLFVPFVRLYMSGVNDIDYADYSLAILFVVIALLNVIRTPMLYTINYAGHFKLTVSRTITETVINLVVSITAVFWWGVYGVLIGTVCALMYRSVDIILYANERILERSPWKTFMIHAVNLVSFVAVQILLNSVFQQDSILSFTDLIVRGLVVTIISLVISVLAQSVVFPKHMGVLLELLKSK